MGAAAQLPLALRHYLYRSSPSSWQPEAWAAAPHGKGRELPSDRSHKSGVVRRRLDSGLVGPSRGPPALEPVQGAGAEPQAPHTRQS